MNIKKRYSVPPRPHRPCSWRRARTLPIQPLPPRPPRRVSETASESVQIGFITKFPVDFYDIMVDAAKAWDESKTAPRCFTHKARAELMTRAVIAAIQSFVTQGVDAIVVTPTSPAVAGELQKAVDAGIIVVLVDNDIPDWDGKTSVVGTDNFAGGQLAGQWFLDNLPEGSTLGVMQGVLGNPSLDARVDGMLEVLGDHATVVATVPTDCDQTKGLDAAQNMLTANPDLDAIYAACGPPLVGALEAIKGVGREGDIMTIGFDASPDEVAAILAGTQTGSVAQFPANMGTLGVQTAFDAVMGKPVEKNVDTGTEMVTKDNAADFQ